MTRPCPCSHHLATRLADAKNRPEPARYRVPGSGLDARYEQLRHAALHARAEAFPLGFGMLTRGGVTAWRHALGGLAPAGPGTAAPACAPPGTHPAPATGLPAPVAAGLISVLAAVALAGTATGPSP